MIKLISLHKFRMCVCVCQRERERTRVNEFLGCVQSIWYIFKLENPEYELEAMLYSSYSHICKLLEKLVPTSKKALCNDEREKNTASENIARVRQQKSGWEYNNKKMETFA